MQGSEVTTMKASFISKTTVVALAACSLISGAGCDVETFPFDIPIEGDDSTADSIVQDLPSWPDTVPGDPSLRILQPADLDNLLSTGPTDFVFRYDDPASRAATITLSGAGMTPAVLEVDGPGEYLVTFVPAATAQGSQSLLLEADTSDGRAAHALIALTVDTLPPEIFFEQPTPPPFAQVTGNIPVRVRVTDAGTQVHGVRINVMDFEWEWTIQQAGSASPEVVTTTYEDLEIPVAGWTSGTYTVTVTATDGVDGHDTSAVRSFIFSRAVEFAAEGAGIPESGGYGIGGAGIRIGIGDGRRWGIVTSAGVFRKEADGIDTLSTGMDCDSDVLWAVIDANSDGTDDFAAYCGDPGTERLAFMMQSADGSFAEATVHSGALALKDLAVGDLNGDGNADFAFLENEISPLGIVKVILSLTDETGALTGWAPIVEHLGSYSPSSIEIGLFTDNGRNAVEVTSSIDKLLTVFPVDLDGSLQMGEDSFWGETPFKVTAAADFCSGDAYPDSLIGVDSSPCAPYMYIARLDDTGSSRLVQALAAPSWLDTTDIDVGDVDGNGVGDIALLCSGANMILFFKGGGQCDPLEFADNGMALVSGGATDIWFSDWNNDGYLDLFGMTGDGVTVTYFRMDARGGHFDGSYQVRLPESPRDVVAGHFLAPLDGDGAAFLDAAVLAGQAVTILAADEILGQPLTPAFSPPPFDEDGCPGAEPPPIVEGGIATPSMPAGPKTPLAMSIGRFGTPIPPEINEFPSVPDGLIFASGDQASATAPNSSASIVFREVSHWQGCATASGIPAGNAPRLVASGLFDLRKGDGGFHDAAFVWHRERTTGVDPIYFLMALRGNGDGTFVPEIPDIVDGEDVTIPIEALPIEDKRIPGVMVPYPLRRSLAESLDDALVPPDLLVGNQGTSDFTVFLGTGDGRFLAKYDGSLDFAVGLPPVGIAAGYLDAPVDGSAGAAVAAGELPDVVTLTRDGNTSVLVISHAMTRAELAERNLEVGFEVPQAFVIYQPGGGVQINPVPRPVAVDLADLDRDGWIDIIVLDQARSSILVFLNQGDLKFGAPLEFFTGREPSAMRAADVDGDGCTDVLTADGGGRSVSILRNRSCDAIDAHRIPPARELEGRTVLGY